MKSLGSIIETFLHLVMSVCRPRICNAPTAYPRFELITGRIALKLKADFAQLQRGSSCPEVVLYHHLAVQLSPKPRYANTSCDFI